MERLRQAFHAIILAVAFLVMAVTAAPSAAANYQKITMVSGDGQVGIVGTSTADPLKVRVCDSSGKPVAKQKVFFKFVSFPEKCSGQTIENSPSLTNKDGIAESRVTFGSKSGNYLVAASTSASDPATTCIIRATALDKAWILLLVLGMIGGLGLFLHGMKIMGNGIKDWGGDSLKSLITSLTRSPILGVALGVAITTIFQSSSATTVTLVGFTNAGLCKFSQVLSICLGANIGATTTGQLVAFKLTDYALFFVGMGFFISLLGAKSNNVKSFGEVLLGFGLLFLGLRMMSMTIAPIKTHPGFISLLQTTRNPIAAFLASFLFTTLLQSSGTTSSLVITFAAEGLIDLRSAIPLLFGANVGTCVTAALSSIGTSRDAKRIPILHYMVNILTVLMLFPFIEKLALAGEEISILFSGATPETLNSVEFLPRQIANVWTLMAIIGTAAFLPLLKPLEKIVTWLVPDQPVHDRKFASQYLDTFLLDTPDLALKQVRLEISRMFTMAICLLNSVIVAFRKRDPEYVNTLIKQDDKIDILEKSLKLYLTKLAKETLTDRQTTLQLQYLLIANEIESMGDVVSKNILPLVQKLIAKNRYFSETGWLEIREYHNEIERILVMGAEGFRLEQLEPIEKIISERNNIVEFYDKYHMQHINRILSGVPETLETTSTHIDLLSLYRRLHVTVVNIAYDIIKNQPGE